MSQTTQSAVHGMSLSIKVRLATVIGKLLRPSYLRHVATLKKMRMKARSCQQLWHVAVILRLSTHFIIRIDIDSITLFMSLEAKAHYKKKKKNLDRGAYIASWKLKVAIHCVFRANFSFCRFPHRLWRSSSHYLCASYLHKNCISVAGRGSAAAPLRRPGAYSDHPPNVILMWDKHSRENDAIGDYGKGGSGERKAGVRTKTQIVASAERVRYCIWLYADRLDGRQWRLNLQSAALEGVQLCR